MNTLRVGLFCGLAVASLLGGGWLIYQGIHFRTYSLALLDPDRSNTVDASIIDRRVQGSDHTVTFRFQPAEPQSAPITSMWVTIPKADYDSLPATAATLPVVYVKGAPEWYKLKVLLEAESYRRDREQEGMFLVWLGVALPWVAVAWSCWLCFAGFQPLTMTCQLGCLNDSTYDYTSGAVAKVMTYKTVPRTYVLDTREQMEEVSCHFCSKPIKVRIASKYEARMQAAGLCSLSVVSGLIIGVAVPAFWVGCPAWFSVVSVIAGIAIGAVVFRQMWNWPPHYNVISLIEGRGNVVHSKTTDNGTVIKWYEHEVLN